MKICRNKDRSTPLTHIHVCLLSWLGTGTSIKSDGDEQKEQVVILSEWIDFRSLIQIRINNIKRSMSTNERLYSNILKLLKHFVSAGKAHKNIVLFYKKLYIDCLKIELCLDISQCNPTCTSTVLSKRKSLIITCQSCLHLYFPCYMNDEEYNMICTGYQKYTSVHTKKDIMWTAKWYTKPLSKCWTFNTGVQRYHHTCFSRNGV